MLDPVRAPLIVVSALSFAVNLLLLVPALFMLQVFDRVLTSGSRETLAVLLLGAGIALALMFVLDHLRSRLQGVAGGLLAESLLPRVARRVLATRARSALPVDSESLRDVASLRGLFSAQALLAVFDAPWVVIYVAVIWLAHPVLGMAAVVAALLMLCVALLNDRLTRKNIETLQREASASQRQLEAAMVNAEVAEVMGMAPALLARWARSNADVQALQAPTAQRSVAMAALTRTLRQAIQVAMLGVGAYLVITQVASAGVMVATTILLSRALAPVEQLVAGWKVLAEGRAAYRRLSALFAANPEASTVTPLPAPLGALRAEALVWRPPGREQAVLAGVSLDLAAGQSLAVTGPSGAGKSTLLRLLVGLWVPAAGTVRLDGADVAAWPRDALGPHIGYVPQDVALFKGTVAENIARLQEGSPEAVVAAAQAAGVHELVLGLPQGYDTPVEAGSALLSPGQRQRIALARALYGAPRLLVLDEPNSNLDGAGEQALADVLAALRGRVTVVVVTHRTTLLAAIDKLLVLEGGRVRHFGAVPEVMQAMKQASAQVLPMTRPSAAAERAL